MLIYTLVAAIIVLSILLALVSVVAFKREERLHVIVADLLDRVMARNYGEYAAATKLAPPERARKRRFMTDPELAELERAARAEIGALAASQGAR